MAGVSYRGLPAESSWLRWSVFGLIIGAILVVAAPAAIQIASEWLGTQQDSLPWYSSRLLGFLGYWALTASVLYGLLLSTGILDAISHRAVSFSLHQELSAIGIGLVALHGAVLALDTFIQQSVVDLVVPFAGPYRPIWVGIGQLAFYVMVAVYASFYLRKHIGQRGWRLLHYTTFLAFVGGSVHGLMAGTDTAAPWAVWSYVGATVAVVFLLWYRITLSVAGRRHAITKES
jgi:methionine sulfoxide reductase heme-binding subunit